MGGYIGKLFQEFAVAVSVALILSLLISLTLTPMLCSLLLKNESGKRHGWLYPDGGARFRRPGWSL
jgi:multidrug efflux pump subunit AcrB